MLNGYVVISVIIALSLLLIGGIVFYRDSKALLNRLFLLFSISMSGWLVSNYLGSTATIPYNIALIANKLVFIFGALSTIILLAFVRTLTNQKKDLWWYLLVSLNAIAIVLSFSNLVVNSITANADTYDITFGKLSTFYFVTLILNTLTIVFVLVKSRKKTQGTQRQQVNTILLTLATALMGIILTNVVMPVLFHIYWLTNAGSFFSVIIVVGVAYTIVKHKLFDIRLVVARGLTYGLSIVLVVLIYSLLAFTVASKVFNVNITIKQELFFALFSAISALTFQPIKRFFDRITNKIFYQDAYNSQDVINKINSTLVSTANLEDLLQKSAQILKDNLKTNFVNFYLASNESIEFHLGGSDTKIFANQAWPYLEAHLASQDEKILTLGSAHDEEYQKYMRTIDIDCIIKMSSNDQDVGYMLIGNRKSGNAFSDQDIQLLEIIADEVAIAVQNALRFEEISQFNVTLQQKIDDATKLLQKSNEKLKALDEAKDEFISMASHQLRTPLTSVKGYLSMLMEGDAGPINDQQKTFLDQAFLSSQRMVYLIADLLNVSRLKTGKFLIEPNPTYLPDVIESEIAQLYETAKARGLKMVFNKPSTFPTLNLDETKIRQVIMNFVDNAIYYTPHGGKITINLKESDESIEFTVHDTGIGVPKAEQHHLFTKFYRAGNAKKARPDGTGLGLFMAKKVIVAQGGAIIFKTEDSKGSTFGFSFPRARVEVSTDEKSDQKES